ncbi:MAG: DNA-binding NtrC family response regulator [Oleiphilaceae bacterium]|jgi:DNA-binding NtrC family response regulator
MLESLLIVDDDLRILSSLKRSLRKEKCQVHISDSPKDALQFLQMKSVDVVLSDYSMPSMSGANFLEHVALRYPHIIRIMLTGNRDFNTIKDAVNTGGISYFINKPWDDVELISLIKMAFIEARNQKKGTEYSSLDQIR